MKHKIAKSITHALTVQLLTAVFALQTFSTFALSLSATAAQFYFEKDSSLPLVYVTAAFRGGATQDPDGKNGVTDLMGKLMLRGTKTKSKQQLDLTLDQMGASLEFETRGEFISFRGAVLAENITQFLSLMDEIVTAPSFRAQDLEKLKKEQSSQLLEELGQDRSLIRLRFDQAFFKNHPYAKNTNGKIKDLSTITVADIQKQYAKLIVDSQMVFLGSGDAQESSFQMFLGDVKSKRGQVSTVAALPEFTAVPEKLRVVIFDKPDRTQTQILIGQKGVAITDPDMDALSVANYAFGGGSFQARLMTELRVKRGWTYGAGSSFRSGSKAHTWKIGFFPKNADTPPAIKEALHMVSDLKKSGITQAEYDAAMQSLVNSAGFTFNTPMKRLENKLIEVIYHLPNDYFRDYAKRLKTLTLAQVNQAMQKFLTPEHMMIGIVGTASISKAEIAKTLGMPESAIEVQSYQKE